MKVDIMQIDKRYERTLERWKELEIHRENKRAIDRFMTKMELNGLKRTRLLKYYHFFIYLFKFYKKDILKANRSDIEQIIAKIDSEKFSIYTKHDCRKMLKKFFKVMLKDDQDYPDNIKWLKSGVKKCDMKVPDKDDLLIQKDVDKLIKTSKYARDKAFISLLYDSGTRVSEIGNLTISNIMFDDKGAIISVNGKTGQRNIRIVKSVPYLKDWLKEHKYGNDKSKPLWITMLDRNKYKVMKYENFRMMLIRLFKKAGYSKDRPCHPHIFRHSRATEMANHLTSFQMNAFFGWFQGSSMPATYIHLNGKDIDNVVLEMNGIKQETTKEEIQKVKEVVRPQKEQSNIEKKAELIVKLLQKGISIDNVKRLTQ